MNTKRCTKCNVEKSLSEFHKHKCRADGYSDWCKVCKKDNYYENAEREKTRRRAAYKNNRERELSNNSKWQNENREQVKIACKNWREKNPEKASQSKRNWLSRNLAKNAASATKYYASKKNRTPPWLTKEHFIQIEEFYRLAEKLTKETGIRHSVDHIMPMQGLTSSGLHVPWNLQVLTASENSKKGNRV